MDVELQSHVLPVCTSLVPELKERALSEKWGTKKLEPGSLVWRKCLYVLEDRPILRLRTTSTSVQSFDDSRHALQAKLKPADWASILGRHAQTQPPANLVPAPPNSTPPVTEANSTRSDAKTGDSSPASRSKKLLRALKRRLKPGSGAKADASPAPGASASKTTAPGDSAGSALTAKTNGAAGSRIQAPTAHHTANGASRETSAKDFPARDTPIRWSEETVVKQVVERFIEHRFFEVEYVFEVRFVGERFVEPAWKEVVDRKMVVTGEEVVTPKDQPQ